VSVSGPFGWRLAGVSRAQTSHARKVLGQGDDRIGLEKKEEGRGLGQLEEMALPSNCR
jgi:hypothetical protein